jgi:hypothetical protein
MPTATEVLKTINPASAMRAIPSLHPVLQFRYRAEFPEFKHYPVHGFSIHYCDLPKWTRDDGFQHPLKMKFYSFELEESIEKMLLEISQNPKNIQFLIHQLTPAEIPIRTWTIEGDATFINFGIADWTKDEVVMPELEILPKSCHLQTHTKNANREKI